MKNQIFIVFVALIMVGSSCQREQEWTALFNGQDLSNWDKFLGSSLGPDFDSLAQAATLDKVFSVVEMEGENVIRISGEINGSLATPESFENYHLRLVFKWGESVYSRRNSGLLYHSFGGFGAAFATWMPNIEFQMMHQNLGDTYLMLNTTCKTEAIRNEETGQFVFTPGADALTFGEHANGRMIRKDSDQESPFGEWNTIELFAFGRIAVHVVNGHTVMVNTNTGVYENGVVNPLVSGRIQIQSEGAEFFVKSIEIKPITSLPDGLLP